MGICDHHLLLPSIVSPYNHHFAYVTTWKRSESPIIYLYPFWGLVSRVYFPLDSFVSPCNHHFIYVTTWENSESLSLVQLWALMVWLPIRQSPINTNRVAYDGFITRNQQAWWSNISKSLDVILISRIWLPNLMDLFMRNIGKLNPKSEVSGGPAKNCCLCFFMGATTKAWLGKFQIQMTVTNHPRSSDVFVSAIRD